MFVSLSAVMLKLCEPFLDASFSKRDKIDASYILHKARVDFRLVVFLYVNAEGGKMKGNVKLKF